MLTLIIVGEVGILLGFIAASIIFLRQMRHFYHTISMQLVPPKEINLYEFLTTYAHSKVHLTSILDEQELSPYKERYNNSYYNDYF